MSDARDSLNARRSASEACVCCCASIIPLRIRLNKSNSQLASRGNNWKVFSWKRGSRSVAIGIATGRCSDRLWVDTNTLLRMDDWRYDCAIRTRLRASSIRLIAARKPGLLLRVCFG